MGMPQIPEGTHRPDQQEAVLDLLASIALEEMALSHLLNAQGEKSQALVQQFQEAQIDYHQMMTGFQASQQMINSVIMNQWLLYIKLDTVTKLPTEAPPEPPERCPALLETSLSMPDQCQRCSHRSQCQLWR